jgi:hypothetical protein
MVHEQSYRSRSESVSMTHTLDFAMGFAPQQQQQQQQTTQVQGQTPTQVFALSPPRYNHTHNHGAGAQQTQTQTQTQRSRAGSFEPHHVFEQSTQVGDSSAAYGGAGGSPYPTNSTASGSMSNASSPAYTGNGNGTTASSFSQGASPQSYYHVPQGYDGQQRQQGMMSMEAMVDPGVGVNGHPPPIFDVKSSPSLGVQQQQQMQRHLQYQDPAQTSQMVPAVAQAGAPQPPHTWNTAPRQLLHRLPHQQQGQGQGQGMEPSGGPYWSPGGASIFY